MKNTLANLLDIDLQMFDGDDTSPTPTSTSTPEGSGSVVNTPQQTQSRDPLASVVYGKVDGVSSPDNARQEPEPEVDRTAKYAEFKSQFKDEFGKEVEAIIKDRFKKNNGLEMELSQIKPVIELLKEQHNVQDVKALYEMLEEQTLERIADRDGYDIEQVREIQNLKKQNKELMSRFQGEDRQKQLDDKIANWYQQEKDVKTEYPEFSLDAQATNESFIKLLDAGIDVKTAYEITNMDAIKENIAKRAEQNTVTNIQAKKSRIKEGALKPSAGVIVKSDPSKFTAEDRKEIARRVMMGEEIKL